MKLARFAVLITILSPWGHGDARARAGQANGAAPPPQAPPSETATDPGKGAARPDEIVITAQRYGDAKVEAETEVGEAEIASYGADSIEELLKRLGPIATGSDEEPVILVNGQEVGFDRSVLGYPAEALSRIAVLRPEAAARYGHPPGRRVVNLVLKKNFASRNADAEVEWATRGGQYGGGVTASQVAIAGPVRWNVQARVALDSALPKSARNVPPRTGPIDLTGYAAGLGQAEIDPALSRAAGGLVTIAAFPGDVLSRPPALKDFVATANRDHPADPRDFETLRPSRRNLSLRLGMTRPLGPFSASLSVNAASNSSSGRRGVPMASIVLPAGSPWSPFADDVLLVRPLRRDRPLRSETSSDSLGAALSLSGTIGGWQTNVAASYTRNWASSLLERGIDTVRVQELVSRGDPAFNPYAPWGDRLLLAETNRSRGENMSARFGLGKSLIDLPAGPVTASLSANASRSSVENRRIDNLDALIALDRRTRDQLYGQLSFGVPISRRGEGELWRLGDLALDLSLGGHKTSGSQWQKRYGTGLTWSPFAKLQLRGSFDHEEVAPTFEQLDGPRVETVLRIYDFARQEVAEPVWITGGNPLLRAGSRQNRVFGALLRPFGSQALSIDVSYRAYRGTGGVAAFPELTPVIEAAFPERVTRDAAGRLVAVDARAINIARSSESELVSGITLRLPDPGAKPKGPAEAKAADPLRLTLTLNHRWRLRSELLTRPGVPVIDQLRDTGQSRHLLSIQAVAGKKAFGTNVSAIWSSAARLRDRAATGPQAEYRYAPPLRVDLGLFVDPEDLSPSLKRSRLLDDMRISLDIDNLLNDYRRATLGDGSVPAGYSRDEVDPVGRTIKLSVRKRF
ncbi:TonB-dependent receptor [Sphingomonas sp. BT-65]|uniref:TonB-dependent receptor n=1 Tax=Sphingomonas sp. BT-65 TaxID=2989821 RepID=UPI002235A2AB|nr:TonB-dependent receptor [Sphingomonas sp. BT-65]MCW4462301.1 TonB-dependent receptor [Sphingomonas sp. BT-65]